MIIADLNIEKLETASEADLIRGGQSTPPVVFQGTSSGVTTIANFNPNGSATQATSTSSSSLTGSFPSFNVNFGTSTTTTSVPVFPPPTF
ncbi:hypothetical protein [Nostoc sphaeroides]|uniref:Uncharacterized protein n=1 Tax=Nostoc sphaeroides CCNUC1 TaxID=2653204 RepID=A0A5P8W3R1_9NOSO|nr:hypothetical protein [Nostoc sphaeroides]QFS47282.1 hypothetical protein GXM_04772 [Nostoc sphaeroides CCNUC1]